MGQNAQVFHKSAIIGRYINKAGQSTENKKHKTTLGEENTGIARPEVGVEKTPQSGKNIE